MAYTASQLASIESAIMALATGARAIRVTFNGRTVEYNPMDLPQLRALRDEIKAELNAGSHKGYSVVRTGKGYE